MAQFGPVLTAMVTPFTPDGKLDLDAAQALATHLVTNGNSGLVLAGTTGESPTLTHTEQIDLIRAVVEAVPGASIVAGAGSNDTAAAIELTAKATSAGADAILTVTPYYNRPAQAGLYHHFAAVANATDLPVMLYDIPFRTGRKLETATILELAQIDNITSLKDAAGSPADTAQVIAQAPEGFDVYSGDDSLTLPLLAVGAVGVVGVATHWVGNEMASMIEAFGNGDVNKALELNQLMASSYDFESSDDAPNPLPTKALMNLMGVQVGPCRPPLSPAPDDLQARAQTVLNEIERSRN